MAETLPTDSQTALIIHPDLKSTHARRDTDAQVHEIVGLAQAIALEACYVEVLKVLNIQPGTFIGKGQIENIAARVEALEPEIVIFNHDLSPVQQRNLEKAFNAKVIDRTGLILEIFGARAQTKEGRLQVELAALDYQRSRLVRSWTHLERQRGGAGFMGGPGERQIELDRRMISERMTRLKKELETVRKTRELGRKARARVPFPVVALVGYTNAGKSSLFNYLTKAEVFAEDLLFATLDPTLRKVELPNGQKIILSDTVGFISDLPTHLIAAFRATLEETLHADVILHVADVSGSDYEAQHKDVIDILESLEIEYESDARILEVCNKIDLLDDDSLEDLERKARFDERMVLVSARTGEGTDDLLEKIGALLSQQRQQLTFNIPYADGRALSWLYEHAELLERQDLEEMIRCTVSIDPADTARFQDQYGYKATV